MDPRDKNKENEIEEQIPDTERSPGPPDLEGEGGETSFTDGIESEDVIIEDDDGDYG